MGKRYYCDYCERSFADGAENRKKHLASVNHQKLRKAHYDLFKDAATTLEENKMKNSCHKLFNTGHCEFGFSCKYSHLSPLDIQKLEDQVRNEKFGNPSLKRASEVDLDSWLRKKVSKKSEVANVMPLCPSLPAVLSHIPNLPPSLIPSKPSDCLQKKSDPRTEMVKCYS